MTTPTRDELAAFPCYYFGYTCSEECSAFDAQEGNECEVRDVYRAHIKLLALRAAVLRGMPPRVAREIYQGAEQRCERASLYTATERIRAIIEWIEGL